MLDLLPCPFCGSPAKLCSAKANASGTIFVFWVHCDFRGDLNCDVIPTTPKFDTAEKAVKAWNTRASGWISCSERMPEDNVDVLVYDDGILIARYNADEKYTSGWMESFECYPLTNVTHWMPLPEPPEVTNNVD